MSRIELQSQRPFLRSTIRRRIALYISLPVAVALSAYNIWPQTLEASLISPMGTLLLLSIFYRWERFYTRIILYVLVCVIVSIIWVKYRRHEDVVAVATMLSIFLASLAIDLAVQHVNELRVVIKEAREQTTTLGKVIEQAQVHGKQVDKVEALIRSTFGLASYIEQAAQIYKENNVARIVTSLRHWVARGEPAKWITEGVSASTARKLVFVGTIEWNVYYPGVLWRFVMLRQILAAKRASQKDQEIVVHHVEEGVPLFVVSKRTGSSKSEKDRGSLLVGNPMETGGTNLYGITLGSDHPQQVDHYNFVFDTLVCPSDKMRAQLRGIFNSEPEIEQPYFHCDGITKIFKTRPFNEGGYIYCKETVTDDSDQLTQLIDKKAKYIGWELSKLIEQYAHRDEERAFLPTAREIEEWAAEFLRALHDSQILSTVPPDLTVQDGEGEVTFSLDERFNLIDKLPTCADFFSRGTQGQNAATKPPTDSGCSDT